MALAAGFAAISTVCEAQTYPNKPIRIIVPHPPGGTTDLIARILATKMSESMGQPVLIDHKPGGSTMIASAALATAPADGYTLMVHIGQVYTIPMMYKNVPYKVENFAPISLVATVPYSLSVSKTVPVKTPKELVEYIRANPGKINYATLGSGGNTHLLGKMLEEIADVRMTDVPYKGSAQAMVDLMGGRTQLYFDTITTSIPQFRGGKINILGVTSAERMPGAPDIPTLKEQGLPLVGDTWWGVLGPAALPRPVIDRIHSEVVKAVASQEFQSKIIAGGGIPVSSASPEEFERYISRETEMWAKVIRPLKLQLD
jgi:tripartite-type tricarboxylate transporter receptor subunit TctC